MGLEVGLIATKPALIFAKGCTHNLADMAKEAGIYMHLWCPHEIGIKKAHQLIYDLERGLQLLLREPSLFKELAPKKGRGSYEGFVEFVTEYLSACKAVPDADVETW